jgi:PAS domain S-box-containing protein
MEKATILVVEDEAITAMNLQLRLQHMGYDVPDIVAKGEDAIDKAREIRPDLLLMDIILAGQIDGIEAARQIRLTNDIPVIYLSAYTDNMLSERAKHTEPFGYLSKPLIDSDLFNTIEMALYKHGLEKALREEKKFTEKAIDAQIDTFFVFDPVTGKAIRWNKRFREVSGYTDEEIANLKAPDFYYSPEDLEKEEEEINKIINDGQGRVEISLICKDGRKIPTEYIASVIKDEEDNVKYIISIGRDITERRQAQKKIKVAESRLRSLIEQTTDAVFCYECNAPIPVNLSIDEQVKMMYDCTLVDCNLVCAKSYGEDRVENVIGRKLTDLFGTIPGSLDKLFKKLIEGGYRIEDGEGVEKLPDGTERFYLNNGYGIIENGMLLRVWGTFRDITERKKLDDMLKESENRYRAFIEDFHGIAFRGRFDFKPILFHGSVEKITGYTESNFLEGDLSWDQMIHPEDLPNIPKESTDPLLSVPNFSCDREYRIINKDGQVRWVHEYIQNVCDDSGKPSYLQGAIYDITESKAMEIELKKRVEELEEFYEISVSRERKIMELKKEIKQLKSELSSFKK